MRHESRAFSWNWGTNTIRVKMHANALVSKTAMHLRHQQYGTDRVFTFEKPLHSAFMGSWRDRWPNTRTKAIWYAKSCRLPLPGPGKPLSDQPPRGWHQGSYADGKHQGQGRPQFCHEKTGVFLTSTVFLRNPLILPDSHFGLGTTSGARGGGVGQDRADFVSAPPVPSP